MAKIEFPESSLWDVDLDERSFGVYRLHGSFNTGNVFEISGTQPEQLIQQLREYVLESEQALESKKPGARN